MDTHWTKEEIREKIDWEGGILECLVGYGLSPEYLPKDTPFAVRKAWVEVQGVEEEVAVIEKWLDAEDESETLP